MTRARDLASATPGSTGIPFRMASGTLTGTTSGLTTVTFPAGRFTQAPVTVVSCVETVIVPVVSISSTGFTTNAFANFYGQIQVRIAFGIFWQAIQMTSGSASG